MTTTADTTAQDLPAVVAQVTKTLLDMASTHGPLPESFNMTRAAEAELKQLGYGHCAYCCHPGGPDTLEVINKAPSFACREQKACLRRQCEAELSRLLAGARDLVAQTSGPVNHYDLAKVARPLAAKVTRIEHLLARLGVAGAELHPELED